MAPISELQTSNPPVRTPQASGRKRWRGIQGTSAYLLSLTGRRGYASGCTEPLDEVPDHVSLLGRDRVNKPIFHVRLLGRFLHDVGYNRLTGSWIASGKGKRIGRHSCGAFGLLSHFGRLYRHFRRLNGLLTVPLPEQRAEEFPPIRRNDAVPFSRRPASQTASEFCQNAV